MEDPAVGGYGDKVFFIYKKTLSPKAMAVSVLIFKKSPERHRVWRPTLWYLLRLPGIELIFFENRV
jgi:hypothetical protein